MRTVARGAGPKKGLAKTRGKQQARPLAKARPQSGGLNHKSPEAAKRRADIDSKVLKHLRSPKTPENGVSKRAIAEALSIDATEVKASLTRLTEKKLAKRLGSTVDSTYTAAPQKPVRVPAPALAGPRRARGADEEQ